MGFWNQQIATCSTQWFFWVAIFLHYFDLKNMISTHVKDFYGKKMALQS
jgi:hypothetical protein